MLVRTIKSGDRLVIGDLVDLRIEIATERRDRVKVYVELKEMHGAPVVQVKEGERFPDLRRPPSQSCRRPLRDV